MPRVRPYEAGLHELRWLTLPQAMTYTHRLTVEQFQRDFGVLMHRKKAPKGYLYDKNVLDKIIDKQFDEEWL